jgi:hypothetical protein
MSTILATLANFLGILTGFEAVSGYGWQLTGCFCESGEHICAVKGIASDPRFNEELYM